MLILCGKEMRRFFQMREAVRPVVLSAVLLMLVVAGVNGLTPLNDVVDWSTIPTTVPGARNLQSATLGQCICDLTASGCDPNCCCDPDCTTADVQAFAECLPATIGLDSVNYCYTPDSGTQLVRINNFGGTLDASILAKDAVCLVRNNYPSGTDAYFTVPTTVAKPVSTYFSPDWFSPDVSESGFVIGAQMPLVRFVNLSGTPSLRSVDGGYLSVPLGGDRGECSATRRAPVAFLTPVTSASCIATERLVTSPCDAVSLDRFTQVEALATPALSVTAASLLIPIDVRVVNATTGALLYNVDTLPLRQSFATLGASTDPTLNTTTTPLATAFSGAGTCHNAVTHVRTVIAYDMSLSPAVRSATRYVFVDDSADVASGAVQQHEVFFVHTGSTSMPSTRSGNPGYLTGAAIPAGVLLTQSEGKQAIQTRVGGFAIPSGGEPCSANRFRSVPFMHNVLNSGCTVSFTEASLVSMCQSSTGTLSLLNSIFEIPSFEVTDGAEVNTTNTLLTHVAMTADAKIEDTSSWLPLTGIPLAGSTPNPYNAVQRSCSNIVVGLSYTFVVARAGAEANPQDVLVGAFVDPILGTWTVRNDTDLSTSAMTTQSFRFRVRFERFDANSQATTSRRIVPPPILPQIDNTIFYPFRYPN